MSFDQKEIKEIQRQMNKKKPNMSIGGKISSLVININKNKSFDAKEGNLMKIKMMNIGVSLEMFNTDEDVNINNNISSNKEQDSKKSIHIEKEKKRGCWNEKVDHDMLCVISFPFFGFLYPHPTNFCIDPKKA